MQLRRRAPEESRDGQSPLYSLIKPRCNRNLYIYTYAGVLCCLSLAVPRSWTAGCESNRYPGNQCTVAVCNKLKRPHWYGGNGHRTPVDRINRSWCCAWGSMDVSRIHAIRRAFWAGHDWQGGRRSHHLMDRRRSIPRSRAHGEDGL